MVVVTGSRTTLPSSFCSGMYLLGVEQLHLQNIWMFGDDLGHFPNDLLGNLAGNAFETSCCAAVVFSLMCLLSEALPSTMSMSPGIMSDGSDSDDDCDLDLRMVWRRVNLT